MSSLRKVMCFLNIEEFNPFQTITQVLMMKLSMSRMSPLYHNSKDQCEATLSVLRNFWKSFDFIS